MPLLLAAVSQAASANPSTVTLHTDFTGRTNCLDIVNAGDHDQLHMLSCANVTGQQWHMDQTGPGQRGRLWNQFTGLGKCLDIVNDGSGRVQLATCGNYSGQFWSKRASR